jgi:predicted porin
MNTPQLAAAIVAGALALPGAASAQSSVTISGNIKLAVENVRLDQSSKSPSSEGRVADELSRILFQVVEDLGGGLQAVAQIDWRVVPDAGTDAASGNNWVGLRSKDWGSLLLGRFDLHYHHSPSDLTAKAGSLKAWNVSLLSFAGGGGTAVGLGTRTANVVRYESPKWRGFTLAGSYSMNPAPAEADIGSAVRKGRAWSFVPSYEASNWQAAWSHWRARPDAFASADQQGDRLWGSYTWGGFKLGIAWDRAKLISGATGVVTSKRTAWSLPLRYARGPHTFHAEYTRARDDAASAAPDGARMLALAYTYDLSKRTSLGLTYAKITNDAGAFYNLYNSAAAQGSASAAVAPGEDPRIWSFGLRHAF